MHKRQNTANAASRRRVIDSLNIEANISSSRNKGSSAQRQRSNTDITSPHNEASRPVAADYQVTELWCRVQFKYDVYTG